MIVLMSPGKSEKNNNQYIDLLINNLPDQIEVIDFTFFKALFKKYPILHVHWPDRLYRANSKIKTLIKRTLLSLLLIRIFVLKTSVVWTVHDKSPHEEMTLIDKFFNYNFTKCIKSKIYLQTDPYFNKKTDFVIKHGNYIREVAQIRSRSFQKDNLVVCIGFLRPSKNIENLIQNFPIQNKFILKISGQPISTHYGRNLLLEAKKREDIIFKAQRLSSDELKEAYQNCFCSIIPYINPYNSGAAIFSLSIPRPVIATISQSMIDLQLEVGTQWLQLIPQNFQNTDILLALDNLSASRNERGLISPLSNDRDWEIIGSQHLAVYSSF